MIVEQIGYLKLEDVLKLREEGKLFSIYKTHKKNLILVLNTESTNVYLYYPKRDRLPWKVLQGKHIIDGIKIFGSNETTEIDTSGWNNSEQIMSYDFNY